MSNQKNEHIMLTSALNFLYRWSIPDLAGTFYVVNCKISPNFNPQDYPTWPPNLFSR